jgi:hypothetical protein
MVFLPAEVAGEAACKEVMEAGMKLEGFEIVGWRTVPVDHSVVGEVAKVTEPSIAQIVVKDSNGRSGPELERALYLARKAVERRRADLGEVGEAFYISSLSGQVCDYSRSEYYLACWGCVGGHRAAHCTDCGARRQQPLLSVARASPLPCPQSRRAPPVMPYTCAPSPARCVLSWMCICVSFVA